MVEWFFNALGALLVAAVMGVGFVISKRSAKLAAAGGGAYSDAARAMGDALARLGYAAVPGDHGGPGVGGQVARTSYTRPVGNRRLHWTSETLSTGTSMRVSMRWSLPLERPAPFPFQVVSADLVSTTGRVRDAALGRSRAFTPAFPVEVPLPFAGPLRAFTTAGHEQQVLQRFEDEGLVADLAALPHVNLVVDETQALFDDPFQDALTGLLGGPLGMRNLLTPQGIERMTWLHESIARLLARF